MTLDHLFTTIEELVLLHSPSGVESEIDGVLLERFKALGVETWQDDAGNVIAFLPGQSHERTLAITGHKDEIGMIVKAIEANGRLQIRRLGGTFPWVYGEGVVDILGDQRLLQGVLSFGSRHISHESPQKVFQENVPLKWEDTWVETKLSAAELEEAGVRPGSRVVVGNHRKRPFRLGGAYIASYTLDNKAAVAILLALAEQIQSPRYDVYLVASAKEEVGAIGVLHFTQRQKIDELIALEVCPIAPEYPVQAGEAPVLLSQDGYGVYDEQLNQRLREAAQQQGVPLQLAVLSGFGSDGSIAMKSGHVARSACLGFPTENTHGYEIAHLGAISNCIQLLRAYCEGEK
ncbi:M42 family metallopeptidase [Leptolyngbya sp. FACHB-261]|uniref:M42 family metallopeptidase n=1 Tax=Leptolyngbya sp. FACHB-261 TaxID=2692806 RepID=UPI001683B302|nr:M20/M25/M40 family metallo-hydrolase [Leptolyngbya sp. FACHB-261]MBD2101534.1 M20/M25/M40 family metallo-hydrolase [Leptolyngbya sp. FACHB-261]